MRASTALVLPALLSFAAASVADTLVVDPDGGGDYLELGDAVAAAAPGDVVLLVPGQHLDYGEIVVDKPLTILGAGSATTSYQAVPVDPFDTPLPLLVTGLGSGEEVRVAGLTLSSAAVGGTPPIAAVISACVGPVVLSDVAGTGAPVGIAQPAAMVRIDGCSQVTLDGCSFVVGSNAAAPVPALLVQSSQVWVNGCVLQGGSTTVFFGGGGNDGAAGLRAIDAVVRVSRSEVRGGDGTQSNPFFTPQLATAGGAAIEALGASQVYARGGAGNALRGGDGGDGFSGQPLYGAGGPAISLVSGSSLTTTPDVVASAGADGDGPVTTPVVVGPGAWAPLSLPLATLESTAKIVAPGGTVDLELGGEPNTLFATFFALAQGPALVAPGFAGPIVLPLDAFAPLLPALLDGSGAGALAVALPPSPALVGLGIVVQGLELSSLATFSVSAPTFVGIR